MKKLLLIRADDLGFSKAVNLGIAETIRTGFVRNVGLMVNMEAAEHGYQLISDCSISVGLHCNISVGKPLSSQDAVPSLVDSAGIFYPSIKYRESDTDFASFKDLCTELTAQFHRFVEITGKKPSYFEIHAVSNRHLDNALKTVAEKYGLFYHPAFSDFTIGGKKIKRCHMYSMDEHYNATEALMNELQNIKDTNPHLYVCHPGYLDDYLLKNSSLTIARTQEVEMLCNPKVLEWLIDNDFYLTTYDELKS